MKYNLLFQLLLCMLIICSAMYIRYKKDTDSVDAMAENTYSAFHGSGNLTFSDFAENILKSGSGREAEK